MGKVSAARTALPGPAQAGQLTPCKSALQHAGRVSVLVSKLAPPSLPREEAALWAIASCDILSRAPDYPSIVPTGDLRETCEAVQEAVERASQCVSISSSLQPLGTAERAAVTMISDARRKYFYSWLWA